MTQQRHKHYQCIRAFADGWKIEYKSQRIDEHWVAALNPSFHKEYEYRIVPDAEGWLPWYATEDSVCPVDGDVIVQYKIGDSFGSATTARILDWNERGVSTITRYRIVKEHKTPRAKRTLVKTIKVFSDGSTEEE